MQYLGNIFLYNNNNINKELYHLKLEEMGYYLFDTDNLHKFSLYNKELTPDVLLFDFDTQTSIDYITALERKFERSSVPLIVVSEAPSALIYHPDISHYLTHADAKLYLRNILESYCVGNKNHQILYINLKPFEPSKLKQSAWQKGYSVFEVNNLNSAALYLKNNHPSIICINFLPALSKSQQLFSFPKTFYVENTQNIEEVEQFIN